jgi:hypothetical protein
VLRRVAESECRLQPSTEVAKYRLQCRKFIATQFLAQDLKSTLSGQHDGVAGEAEAKAASRMAPRSLVEELTRFNRDLF